MCLSGVYMPSACHMKDSGVCGREEHIGQVYCLCMCVCERHCEVMIQQSCCFHWSGIGREEYVTNHNHGNVCFSF